MEKSTTQIYLPLIMLILLTNCSSIKKLVNKEFEPLLVKDQQIRAITQSSESIDSLSPNISLHIGKEILDSLLINEIEKIVLELDDPTVEIHSFKPVISLTKQAIIIDAEFIVSLSEIESKLEGKIRGYIGVSSIRDTLLFLPALKTLRITNISFLNRKPKLKNRAIAGLIKPVTKHFLDNLNRLFFQKTPSTYTGWGEIINIETGSLFTNDETTVNGPIVEISRYVKTTSWLINKSGVSVLLELENEKSVIDPKSTKYFINTESNVDVLFRNYQNKFNTTWLNNFQTYSDSVKISVGVTKKTLSSVFNDVLSTSTLNISHTINIPKESSVDDLEIDRLKLDCNGVREKFSFPDFEYGSNCDYSCMKTIKVRLGSLKISKRIDDPICGAARAACKVTRETARVAWQTTRETARIAHQVYNEGRVAACKLAVETSGLVDMGKIETSSEGTGKATLELKNIILSNDLSTLKFNTSGNVNLKLKSFLGLYPQDIGHLLMCAIDYRKSITTNLNGDILNQFSEINFEYSKIDDNIVLTGVVSPIGFKASADLSPLHELLLDPELAIKCSLLYSTLFAGGIIGGTAAILGMVKNPELQLLLKGSAIGSYELNPFTQKISPIVFRVNQKNELKSEIIWSSNSIEFRY